MSRLISSGRLAIFCVAVWSCNPTVKPAGPGADAGNPDADERLCVGEAFKSDPKPLDLFLLLDSSGSMAMPIYGGSVSKWTAVVQALEGFASDAQADNIALGLQLLPAGEEAIPLECAIDDDCAEYGPCKPAMACADDGRICESSANCTPGSECVPRMGTCLLSRRPCTNIGGACTIPIDECIPHLGGFCSKALNTQTAPQCSVARFAMPVVPLGPLASVRPELSAALARRRPGGATPLGPALKGSFDYLRTKLAPDASRKTVLVLASDGFAGGTCKPDTQTEIAALIKAAADAPMPISTYVIGVLSKTDDPTNVNAFAAAGGTERATVLRTDQTFSEKFRKALDDIRGATLPCTFALPKPTTVVLDTDRVNFEISSPTRDRLVVPRVPDLTACDFVSSGWYYADRKPGEDPSQVVVCPQTCALMRQDQKTEVTLRLGCKTVVF